MSGVYIKGMEMPESCASCRFYGVYCYAKGDENAHSTLPCPLINVPDHGRLIDADALIEHLGDVEYKGAIKRVLVQAPTIIPADKEDGE